MILVGASSLVLAYGWYTLGPSMRNPSLWAHRLCRVLSFDRDQGSSSYGLRVRVFFQVAFLGQPSAVATPRLRAWTDPAQADADIRHYPVGNSTDCFCPLVAPNQWGQKNLWSIYNFCIFDMPEAEIASLVFWFQLWFYGGIVTLIVGSLCTAFCTIIYVHTRCFKRRITLFRTSKYDPVN